MCTEPHEAPNSQQSRTKRTKLEAPATWLQNICQSLAAKQHHTSMRAAGRAVPQGEPESIQTSQPKVTGHIREKAISSMTVLEKLQPHVQKN